MRNPRLTGALSLLALMAAGYLVYAAGLHGGFIFDDFPNLVADPDWKVTALDPKQWQRAVAYGISSATGRPLAMLSFAANHYFTGLQPGPMKAVNLGLHLFSGCLVFFLCKRLFALVSRPRLGAFAAWLIAASWLLHPLQVSTVLYVVQRMELGAQCFTLLALLAYLRAREAQIAGRRAWPWFAAAAAAVAAGLGFKETAILAPGYALLIECFVLHFAGPGGTRSRGWMLLYAGAAALAVLLFLFVAVPRYAPASVYATRDFDLGQRLLTQIPVLAMYLVQTLWPIPERLLFYYDQFPVSTGLLSPPATAWSAAALAALVAVAVLARRRSPLIAFGIGWFFAAHALTSNVIPLELAFEHRNYLALLGPLVAIAAVFGWLGERLTTTEGRRLLAALPVAALAFLCWLQVQTWAEPMRLAVALATRNPDSPRATYELGKLLLEEARSDAQSPQWSMAYKEFQNAAALPKSSSLAEQALIIMDARSEKPVPASVWRSFRAKLARREASSQDIQALYGVSQCRIRRQCEFDDQELFQTFLVALERNPRSPTVHVMYADFAFNVMGDTVLATRMIREAIRLRPDELHYQASLAKYLLASGLHEHDQEIAAILARIRAGNSDGRLDEDLRQIHELQRKRTPPG